VTELDVYQIQSYRDIDFSAQNICTFFANNFRFVSRKKFEEALIRIKNGDEGVTLDLLFHKEKIVGGVFWFKLKGVGNRELWSPSHLIVLKEHRAFSIIFINSVFRRYSKKIVDITPTLDVQSILKAIRFNEYTKGSLLVPTLLRGAFKKTSTDRFEILFQCPIEIPHGLSQQNNGGQLWFVYSRSGLKHYVGLKEAQRYKVPFLILIYVPLNIYDAQFVKDLSTYLIRFCWSFILMPDFGFHLNCMHLRLDRMHIWTNAENSENYSLLGTEITEFF
jgi:hypothetical protein